jgi:hypothetical protein
MVKQFFCNRSLKALAQFQHRFRCHQRSTASLIDGSRASNAVVL